MSCWPFSEEKPSLRGRAPPGFRDCGLREETEGGSGKLYYVGYAGVSWSSSILSGSGGAYYLEFLSIRLIPQLNDSRALGFPLRCLQEERR